MSDEDNYKCQAPEGTDCLSGIESMEDLIKSAAAGTLTLPPLTGGFSSSLGSITVNTASTSASYNGGNYGYPYISPSTPTSAQAPYGYSNNIGIGNYSWGTTNNTPVKITTKGLDMNEDCDIKIGSASLKTFMQTVSDRLAILQPNPDKLEKFEALRQAYEHYKTLEALCQEDAQKEDK